MAIQFKCPSCDAMIRVPDTSAGKKGTCPQCSEKLIVPSVGRPSVGTPATELNPPVGTRAASSTAESSRIAVPHIDLNASRSTGTTAVKPEPPRAAPGPVLSAPTVSPVSTAVNSTVGFPPIVDDASPSLAQTLAKKERQKQRAKKSGIAVPIICGLIFLGVLAAFYWSSQPKLEGSLKGQIITEMETPPALISGHLSGLSTDDLNVVLRKLKSSPAEWSSNSARLTMRGNDEGVSVTLKPGSSSQLVGVPAAQNTALKNYLKQNGDSLDKPRLAMIAKHAPQLFEDWLVHFKDKVAMSHQTEHRDQVIFPSLVGGLGYHLEAASKGTRYPCVYEDAEGMLYFLVPTGTKSFTVQGKKTADGVIVAANFNVNVDGSMAAPSSGKKSKPKSREERESENQGMNPDLYKPKSESEGMSEPKSEAEALKGGLGNLLAPGSRPSNTKPSNTKSKPSKSEMMDRPDMMEKMDDEMPDFAMPDKAMPRKLNLKSGMKGKNESEMSDDKMEDGKMSEMSEDEMMEKPKTPPKTKTKK